MKAKKINKVVDLGISELVDKGLDINIVIPNHTFIGIAITIVATASILMFVRYILKTI